MKTLIWQTVNLPTTDCIKVALLARQSEKYRIFGSMMLIALDTAYPVCMQD